MGYLGLAAWMTLLSVDSELPSNGLCEGISIESRPSDPWPGGTNLVVYALVEQHTQRPPVCPDIVAAARVHFRREIRQGAGLACQYLPRDDVGSDILSHS